MVILQFVSLSQNANLAKHVAHCRMIHPGYTDRVRRSYSLKAKLSENEAIFFRFETKRVFHASETLQKAKKNNGSKTERTKRTIAIPVKV